MILMIEVWRDQPSNRCTRMHSSSAVITINSPIQKDHICVEDSQLVRHVKRINLVLLDVLEVVDLSTLAILHHQHAIG